jgi:hypothetical protein
MMEPASHPPLHARSCMYMSPSCDVGSGYAEASLASIRNCSGFGGEVRGLTISHSFHFQGSPFFPFISPICM